MGEPKPMSAHVEHQLAHLLLQLASQAPEAAKVNDLTGANIVLSLLFANTTQSLRLAETVCRIRLKLARPKSCESSRTPSRLHFACLFADSLRIPPVTDVQQGAVRRIRLEPTTNVSACRIRLEPKSAACNHLRSIVDR